MHCYLIFGHFSNLFFWFSDFVEKRVQRHQSEYHCSSPHFRNYRAQVDEVGECFFSSDERGTWNRIFRYLESASWRMDLRLFFIFFKKKIGIFDDFLKFCSTFSPLYFEKSSKYAKYAKNEEKILVQLAFKVKTHFYKALPKPGFRVTYPSISF